MKKCPQCETEYESDNKFCANDGVKLIEIGKLKLANGGVINVDSITSNKYRTWETDASDELVSKTGRKKKSLGVAVFLNVLIPGLGFGYIGLPGWGVVFFVTWLFTFLIIPGVNNFILAFWSFLHLRPIVKANNLSLEE